MYKSKNEKHTAKSVQYKVEKKKHKEQLEQGGLMKNVRSGGGKQATKHCCAKESRSLFTHERGREEDEDSKIHQLNLAKPRWTSLR